jgi:hypothetical protein
VRQWQKIQELLHEADSSAQIAFIEIGKPVSD